ncbi:MAG TPA: hypothetical protein PK268_00535 [Enterococcus sp.]|jgi:hypothetical protein|nr:hypothetical protein [Enterococcus sp.]HPR80396.1 hypothetical protein [Enterococcus sp.]
MFEQFKDLHLTVMELPVEVLEDKPVYSGYLRELPFITGEGNSKVEMYRKLMEHYQEYVESQVVEESTEEMTSSLLSVEQLLKYYDGEVFDGFEIDTEK